MKLVFRWYKTDSMEMNLTVQQCARLWEQYGLALTRAFEEESGLRFTQTQISVRGSEDDSYAGSYTQPMRISVRQKDDDVVLGILTHELAHRLLAGNDLRRRYQKESTEALKGHQKIYLFLYDAWRNALGRPMADRLAKHELDISHSQYTKAWEWAMGLSYQERKEALIKLSKY